MTACNDALIVSIAGFVPGASQLLFSTRDDATPAYVRNVARLGTPTISNIRFVPWSAWTTLVGANFNAVAVGYYTILRSAHILAVGGGIGATCRFVNSANAISAREITAEIEIPGSDIIVCATDNTLPGVAPILPDDYAAVTGSLEGLAVFHSNVQRQLGIKALTSLADNSIAYAAGPPPFDPYNIDLINGDSSSPFAFRYNNTLILLGLAWTALDDHATSSNIVHHAAAIQAAMDTFGYDDTLTRAVLAP